VLDALVEQAAYALQELNPGIAEVVAGGFGPAAFEKRQSGGAEKTALLMMVFGGGSGGIFFFHVSSPSSPQ
jgi:hypothetical protein